MHNKTTDKIFLGVKTKAVRNCLVLQLQIRFYSTGHGVLVKMISVFTYTAGRYFKWFEKSLQV